MRWTESDLASYVARHRQRLAPVEDTGEGERERAFQARLITEARRLGYRTYHTYRSDRSDKGWFDLAMARPGDKLVLAELKKAGRKQSEEQRDWYEDLQRIELVQTFLWYPRDYEMAVDILTRKH
jgi:hypothetical protein